ncbi:MAG: hypothetical protein JWP06_821 [Candidatus Saccharibacteria bacterium]|nr:hypothetical protein [Candidatus Saccharibacteria bacterium]
MLDLIHFMCQIIIYKLDVFVAIKNYDYHILVELL